MKKIKILESNLEFCEDCMEYSKIQSETEWEEVDEEVYQNILDWAKKKNNAYNRGVYIIVLTKIEYKEIESCVCDYVMTINKEKIERKKRKKNKK